MWLSWPQYSFLGLKEKDFIFIVKFLKLLASPSGANKNALVDFLVQKYSDASDRFVDNVLSNINHCLDTTLILQLVSLLGSLPVLLRI